MGGGLSTPWPSRGCARSPQRAASRGWRNVIWHNLEPWTKAITDAWPAVDSFCVSLCLDSDGAPAPAQPPPKRKAKRKR